MIIKDNEICEWNYLTLKIIIVADNPEPTIFG